MEMSELVLEHLRAIRTRLEDHQKVDQPDRARRQRIEQGHRRLYTRTLQPEQSSCGSIACRTASWIASNNGSNWPAERDVPARFLVGSSRRA
jgi:hypothetical protein